jgi:hypothetical protein
MSHRIRIVSGEVALEAELNDTDTALVIYEALPIEGHGNRWGEEIYFEIPIDQPIAEDATEVVAVGSLGYWPPGKALCAFFGPTPASTGQEPRAASPVNPIGRIVGDARALSAVAHGAAIRIEELE